MPGSRRTHCFSGHEFTPENTYVFPKSGKRCCLTCKREYSKGRSQNNDAATRSHLKVRYGITVADKQAMLVEQDRRCWICRRPFTDDIKPFIDHDHATKIVRGLLCRFCNTAIGMFGDSPELLLRAVDYLRK